MKTEKDKVKHGFSVRFDDDTKQEIARIAEQFGLKDSDIIRICVANGLPIVEKALAGMRGDFGALANQAKAKEGRYPELESSAALMNEPKKRKVS